MVTMKRNLSFEMIRIFAMALIVGLLCCFRGWWLVVESLNTEV